MNEIKDAAAQETAMFELIEDGFVDNQNIAEMNAYSYCSCCCYVE